MKGNLDFSHFTESLKILLRDPKTFSGKKGYVNLLASGGSALGSASSVMSLKKNPKSDRDGYRTHLYK